MIRGLRPAWRRYSGGLLRMARCTSRASAVPPHVCSTDADSSDEKKRQKLKSVFTEERQQARKRKLQEETKRGYFDDLHEIKNHKGKLWEARERVNPAVVSPSLPSTAVVNLVGSVSVSKIPYAELSVIEGKMQRWLHKRLHNSLRKRIPQERHHLYFCAYEDTSDLQLVLNVSNKLVGYVFLIDGESRVRWSACGNPTDNELKYLSDCVMRLMEEQQGKSIT